MCLKDTPNRISSPLLIYPSLHFLSAPSAPPREIPRPTRLTRQTRPTPFISAKPSPKNPSLRLCARFSSSHKPPLTNYPSASH
ncbi:MAG: hypothetical protein K2J12_10290, partial [Muribaculaceae bacterium]|nr:hypothetical protein [Muribaculaceae bacterium]